MADRGRGQDTGKRAAFDAFLARMQPDVPPPVPHTEIDNRMGAPNLVARLAEIAYA